MGELHARSQRLACRSALPIAPQRSAQLDHRARVLEAHDRRCERVLGHAQGLEIVLGQAAHT